MADKALTSVPAKEIFPSTKTQTINKLITENSLTRIINRLVDVESYVITSEFDNSDIEKALNNAGQEDYIPVANMKNKDLEVCIRGYYFNLGTIENFISKYSRIGSMLGVAIYVSDDTEYPELYGQEVLETVFVPKENNTGGILIPDGYERTYISNIELYSTTNDVQQMLSLGTVNIDAAHIQTADSQPQTGKTYYVLEDGKYVVTTDTEFIEGETYYELTELKLITNSNTEYNLTWGENYIDGTTYNIDKISFVYRANQDAISVFSVSDNNSFPGKTGYKVHTLTVLQNFNTNSNTAAIWGIPLSSIHKFDTISISNIDGGVI